MNFFKTKLLTVALIFGAALSLAFTQIEESIPWRVDVAHSSVEFKVSHFFTPVTGFFGEHESTVVFDPNNLAESKIDVKINVSSVNTNNARRDNHLKSDDFFSAETFPQITFSSNKIESKGNNNFVAHGTLTIKDVSKPIELPFTLLGIKDNPNRQGAKVAGISANTVIDRTEFKVGTGDWASNAVIGDQVTVTINLELHTQAS